MCGINGLFYHGRPPGNDNPRVLIEGMNHALRHRGPDDDGYWASGDARVHLGHRRLSILDLSPLGHQPMASPAGNVTVYNGEIYNYRALSEPFHDYPFRSSSDTEVLLALYDRDGESCVNALNGMFAFGMWDARRERLFLARDPVGIKPLYFADQNGVFAFSSELRALLTLPWIQAKLDEPALYDFLTFNRVPAPGTLFRGISKFHPGEAMTVGPRGIESRRSYRGVRYDETIEQPEERAASQLLSALRRSVHGQMVSDVPIGAFLSGGVDSSAIVALMSEVSGRPVRTYSIGFDGAPDYDEREHARAVANRYGCEHYEHVVTRKEIEDFVPHMADTFDEPLADATAIPIYFLCEAARSHGTPVILTGDGSDELFCGYRNWVKHYRLAPFLRSACALPSPLRRALARSRGLFPETGLVHDYLSRIARGQSYFWSAGGFKESAKHALIGPRLRNVLPRDSYEAIWPYREEFLRVAPEERRKDERDWMSYLGLKDIVPGHYLHRADRLGMAHSVELRVPFLDLDLVDLAMSLPGSAKIRHGEPKFLLKKALEPILPRNVLYRRKQGFCVPLDEWMKDLVTSHVDDRLKSFCRDTGLLDASTLSRMVAACRAGDRNVTFGL